MDDGKQQEQGSIVTMIDLVKLATELAIEGHANSVRLNFCMAAELSDATGRYGRSTPSHWPTH